MVGPTVTADTTRCSGPTSSTFTDEEGVVFTRRSFACSIGSLAPGASVTTNFFNVTAPMQATEWFLIRAVADATGLINESDTGAERNNQRTSRFDTLGRGDLKVDLNTGEGSTATVGETVYFQAVVKNVGPYRATRIVLDVSRPSNMALDFYDHRIYRASHGFTCRQSNSVVTCDGGALDPNQGLYVDIWAKATRAVWPFSTNTGTVTATAFPHGEPDLDTSNNSDSHSLTIL